MKDNLLFLYNKLYDCYGDLRWCPADTPYELMAGAVLAQPEILIEK